MCSLLSHILSPGQRQRQGGASAFGRAADSGPSGRQCDATQRKRSQVCIAVYPAAACFAALPLLIMINGRLSVVLHSLCCACDKKSSIFRTLQRWALAVAGSHTACNAKSAGGFCLQYLTLRGLCRAANGCAAPVEWVETGDAVSAQYAEARAEAHQKALLRNACFQQVGSASRPGHAGVR